MRGGGMIAGLRDESDKILWPTGGEPRACRGAGRPIFRVAGGATAAAGAAQAPQAGAGGSCVDGDGITAGRSRCGWARRLRRGRK